MIKNAAKQGGKRMTLKEAAGLVKTDREDVLDTYRRSTVKAGKSRNG